MAEEEYIAWKRNPSPQNMSGILRKYQGILRVELPKYGGNLPPGVLKGYGKKFMMDAVKTYDPNKGKLANHMVTNLQRLHRVNYETSSTFRMSEELQRGVNLYKQTREDLVSRLKRDPSVEELSESLRWSPSKVSRMEKQLKKETLSSALEVSPVFVNVEDPIIDYVYHDLPDDDKKIFQYRTGYRGAPILPVSEVAKRIRVSPATVSNKAMRIAKMIQRNVGEA